MICKRIVFAFVVIVSLIILPACSSETVSVVPPNAFADAARDSVNALDNELDSQSVSFEAHDTGSTKEVSEVEGTTNFDIPTIFEEIDFNSATLGLWSIDPDDETIDGVGGWTIPHGYTYFDFLDDGVPLRVLFYNSLNPIGGADFSIGADTRVSVEINEEWQHAWFFSTQLRLTLVAPVNYWCVNTFSERHALLVVGDDVGSNYHARLVFFEEDELIVLALTPEDSRPDWYLDME